MWLCMCVCVCVSVCVYASVSVCVCETAKVRALCCVEVKGSISAVGTNIVTMCADSDRDWDDGLHDV